MSGSDEELQKRAQEREALILEWMRTNDAFKGLARQFGKSGRIVKFDEPSQEQALQSHQKADQFVHQQSAAVLKEQDNLLLQWMETQDSFKRLKEQYKPSNKLEPKA